jgi:hypothetical protein
VAEVVRTNEQLAGDISTLAAYNKAVRSVLSYFRPAVLLTAFVLLVGISCAADEDERFLEGLRQRRLFELAEKYCTERLAGAQLPPVVQGDLAVELIRTYALHAANSPPDQREELWKRARTAAAEFQRQNPQHSRGILIRMQDALTLLAQGELARQELEAGAADPAESARKALREAAKLLADLDKEIAREIPLRRRGQLKPEELTADELTSLQHNAIHQLARASRNLALLYEAKSADQVAGLSRACELLQGPLAVLDPDEPLAWQIRLDLALCQRLLGNLEGAKEQVEQVDRDGVDPASRLRARAEAIRIELAAKNLGRAQTLLHAGLKGRTFAGVTSADFDFAFFETALALWRAASEAKDDPLAKKYQELALDLAKSLEDAHGPYWGRRADQLLIRSQPGAAAGTEILSRAADNLYLKKEFDQAVAAYDKAADQARAGGNAAGAFELASRAALVQEQRERHTEAARRFRALAVALPTHKDAAAAHLRGAWNEAKEAARDAEAEQTYVAMLAEQIATWPQSESAAQARLWLGKWHAGRKEWAPAVDAFAGITRESLHFPAAVAAVAPAWQEYLRSLAAAGKKTEDEAERAAAWFDAAIVGTDNKLPEKWTATDRLSALEMAKILLDYRPDKYREAEGILQTALDHAGDAPPAWKAEAQSQLVLAIAGQSGRRDDALTMLSQIGQASPEQLLDLLAGLSAVISRSRKEVRPQIAGIQLQAADMLWPQRAKLTKNAALSLTRIRAEALAATGKRAEALAAFAALAKENPDSAAIQEGYADILLSGDAASVKLSLDQWRRILSRAKPRSELWFKAKYSVALAQFKLGEKKEAAAVLRYTLELPPGLAGTVWQEKYQTLLRECER